MTQRNHDSRLRRPRHHTFGFRSITFEIQVKLEFGDIRKILTELWPFFDLILAKF